VVLINEADNGGEIFVDGGWLVAHNNNIQASMYCRLVVAHR
jgi:hypothetical protein